MSVLHILRERDAEVLLDDLRRAEGVWAALYAIEFCGKHPKCVIRAITHEEGEIDEFVWVRQLADEVEVLQDVLSCIAEGRKDEDTLVVREAVGRGLDRVQINVLDCGRVDFDG